LSAHISNCLERATSAEQRALEATDVAVRSEHEMLAKSWRHLADSYQFVESLEKFLADTARQDKGGAPPELPAVATDLPAAPGQPQTPDARPVIRRRRFKQVLSFKDRLVKSAQEARDLAERLPPGPERERLLQKARQSETAVGIDAWISKPGSHPPANFDLGKKPKA
jgi:hypothetical protein